MTLIVLIALALLLLAGALFFGPYFIAYGPDGFRDIVRRGVGFAGLAGTDRQPVLLLILTGVYAATIPFVGFDVGTAAFIALALLIQGERRIWLLVLAALLGSGLTVYLFHDLLMVRMPVLFL